MLVGQPDRMFEYSHFVLDEMHERSMEMDLLCVVVRLIMQRAQAGLVDDDASKYRVKPRDFRLVVMSATLQASKFQNYFASEALIGSGRVERDRSLGPRVVPSIRAGAKRFEVEIR